MAADRLIYLPLGGAGEVGMNMYVYGYGRPGKERYILVDMGVTFPDMDGTPGVDLIFPDVEWIAERVDRLDAIFITHAHEDHVGAVGHLFSRLQAPIYARKFTAHIGRLKMEEHGYDGSEIITVGAMPEMVKAGPLRWGSCRSRIPFPKVPRSSSTRPRGGWCIPATSRSTRHPDWVSRLISRLGGLWGR